jgi:hypothetical protein
MAREKSSPPLRIKIRARPRSSALVRVPFEGWFKRYRTRMNAEAADENLFFFIRVIGARPRPF